MSKTKKNIPLAKELDLPISVVTQKLALLGISGSGKTYASGKLVEGLCDAGVQVVVVDTVGNWWGLRLAANGKSPGIAIPIIGGDHGDVALDPGAGRDVANLITESRASMIVDVSDFGTAELQRFVAAFASTLLAAKKKSPSPVMVVWEECQDVVPQRVTGDVAKTVGAVQKLVKRGRNYGVGTMLISQRPAAVNKDVLSQIETLCAFRMNGRHDRKAIEDWIVSQELDVGGMVDELPTMTTGSCFIWSPQWLGILKKIHIARKKTFDATATPEFGEEVKAGKLAPVDLKAFEKTMAESIEKVRAADPEIARKRIAHLEAQVHTLQRTCEGLEKMKMKRPEARPVIRDGQIAKLERLLTAADVMTKRAEQRIIELGAHTAALASCLGEAKTRELIDLAKAGAVSPFEVRIDTGRASSSVPPPRAGKMRDRDKPKMTLFSDARRLSAQPAVNGTEHQTASGDLDGPEQRIIDAIGWLKSVGNDEPEQTAVAFLAGYSSNSGGYFNPRGRLKQRGLIEYLSGNRIKLTSTGWLSVSPEITSASPLTNQDIHNRVLAKLDNPMRRILEPLLRVYPSGMTNDKLAHAAGYSPTSGGYFNPRGRLKSLGLIEYTGGEVKARSILFV
jgi:hypothetical protein